MTLLSVYRDYNVSDDRMLSKALLFLSLYKENEEEFKRLSPKRFTEEFAKKFDEKIQKGYTIHSDAKIKRNLSKETSTGRHKFSIRYFSSLLLFMLDVS